MDLEPAARAGERVIGAAMWKVLLTLGIAAAAFAATDLWLTRGEGNERASVKKVGRPVSEAERSKGEPKLLQVESAGRKSVYAKTNNGWRCVTYRNAVAADDRVESVIKKVFEAEGIVLSRDASLSQRYGFDVPATIRIEVHGGPPAGSLAPTLIAALEVGVAHVEQNGAFVRRPGESAVWSVDSNPHVELDVPAGSPLPAMLDPSIVPMFWLQQAKQVRGIKIERSGAPPLELEMRDKQITPEEMRQGKLPFDWYSKSAGGEKLCDPNQSMAYTSFLMRAPYSDVIDPAQAAKLGFDRSYAKITLSPRDGAPLELYLAASPTAGRRCVYDSASQSAFEMPEEYASWLLPTEEQLVSPTAPNPWKAFLQMQQPR